MDINDYIRRKRGGKSLTPEEAIRKYAGMDEKELMNELFKVAAEGRASGELNNDIVDGFYQKMLPLLTPEQAERMRELIIKLKQ